MSTSPSQGNRGKLVMPEKLERRGIQVTSVQKATQAAKAKGGRKETQAAGGESVRRATRGGRATLGPKASRDRPALGDQKVCTNLSSRFFFRIGT